MNQLKLYMFLLGCTPPGRHTEQHDVFFSIGKELKDIVSDIKKFWPEGKVHIDAWREVTRVDGYSVKVIERQPAAAPGRQQLFFINLGGYRENEFEEFHYKMVLAAPNMDKAKLSAKKNVFFAENTLEDSATHHMATSHIDDKYGIDVDDVYSIEDILPAPLKDRYRLELLPAEEGPRDAIHLGYLQLKDIS